MERAGPPQPAMERKPGEKTRESKREQMERANRFWSSKAQPTTTVIIIIIEGLSLLQSIPPTTANKHTQAQKKRGSMASKQQQ